MAVVLLAMGGYGALYLGWQIRVSDDAAVIKKAQDLHPKLALGMAFFFALGAVGGMMSMIMQVRKAGGARKMGPSLGPFFGTDCMGFSPCWL
jgi:hypothetical protein